MSEDGTATVSDHTGTPTAGENAGTATAAEDKPAQYTADDVAGIKGQYERKLKKAEQRAAERAARAILDAAGVDSVDELTERVSGSEKVADQAQSFQRKLEKTIKENEDLRKQLSNLTRQRENDLVRTTVTSIGNSAGCIDLDLLHKAIREDLGVDEKGRVFVRDEDGDPSAVSVEKHIKQFLADKPHLQAAAPSTGGGSRPRQAEGSNSADLKTREGRLAAFSKVDVFGR